jgi:hypothetical protein
MSDFAAVAITLIVVLGVVAIAYIGAKTYNNTFEDGKKPND